MDRKIIKIGITGQSGFIGTHLYNTLGLYTDRFKRVPFKDEYFNHEKILQEFVSECDVIIHLAALNRHHDPKVIYETNLKLVKQVIEACDVTGSKPHILFSSSTQEERDNLYGRSKKEGRMLFENWAKKNNANFSGLIIPNVYGPFGNPYYNSVVATFCHQLTHNEAPKIDIDGDLELIYVNELVDEIIKLILGPTSGISIKKIQYTAEIKVSELLNKLLNFKKIYFQYGIIPDLKKSFERNLFNTFLCYIDHHRFFPYKLKMNNDERGSFVETMKLNSGGQVSFSTTKPGITRGNHFHIRKAERFAVIKGQARIQIRKIGTKDVMSFILDGSNPSFVDMPVWHTHNITNIGGDDLYTIFWISEHFNPDDSDTFFEKV